MRVKTIFYKSFSCKNKQHSLRFDLKKKLDSDYKFH
jgi:hypothetical protein